MREREGPRLALWGCGGREAGPTHRGGSRAPLKRRTESIGMGGGEGEEEESARRDAGREGGGRLGGRREALEGGGTRSATRAGRGGPSATRVVHASYVNKPPRKGGTGNMRRVARRPS